MRPVLCKLIASTVTFAADNTANKMADTKPKRPPARRSAGKGHPVTPTTTVTATNTQTESKIKNKNKNKKSSSPKPRLHYDQIGSPDRVFWSRDEYGKRLMSRSPEPDKKRLVPYDSFGFFGPEHADKPTIASTGMETPTVVITPLPPGEEAGDQHEEFLRTERARYLRSRAWLQERKKRATSDLKIVERRDLALPPLQSNDKARVSNQRDNEEREKRRVERILSKHTIESLEDGDGTSSPGA